jgi:vacuolar-type H+-ATPase subunit E/Vma4
MELNRQETDKWNTEIEKIVGIGLTMLQRSELSNYFKSEVKKLTLTDVSQQRELLIADMIKMIKSYTDEEVNIVCKQRNEMYGSNLLWLTDLI